MPLNHRLMRSDTTAKDPATPPPMRRVGRRFSLQPTTGLRPSGLSPSRLSRSPSPNPGSAGSSSLDEVEPPPSTAPNNKKKKEKPPKVVVQQPIHSTCKVLILGSAKVGKTSIIQRFLYDNFNPKYHRTIEELHHAEFTFNSAKLSLEILDTAGSYEFPAMRELNIASSDAFIIVFSASDQVSLDEVANLRSQVTKNKGEKVPMVVVCNKSDDEDKEMTAWSKKKGESQVKKWSHCGFVFCSAKTGENVTEVFKELLSQAKVQYKLSPALRKRRQSTGGMSSFGHSQVHQVLSARDSSGSSGSANNNSSEIPDASELAALRASSKRNSCLIS